MLAKRIIPCLDVKDGRVVKGINFIDLVDAGDPVEQAKLYDKQGADELTFLDITASSDNRNTILDVVRATAEQVFMPLTVGGGVRKLDDIRALLHAGADKVAINTAAVNRPEFVQEAAKEFGTQCIVVAVDAKAITDDAKLGGSHGDSTLPSYGSSGWGLFTHGGRNATGIDVLEWCSKMEQYGAGEILLTSMDRDGTRAGFDLALTKAVVDRLHIPVIASGGVGSKQHFYEGLEEAGAAAALAASIFHFGEESVGTVKNYLKEKGTLVRL